MTVPRSARRSPQCRSDYRFRWRQPTITSYAPCLSFTPRLIELRGMLPTDLFTFNQPRFHFIEMQAQYFLKIIGACSDEMETNSGKRTDMDPFENAATLRQRAFGVRVNLSNFL
jgi:hypothetical protein